MNKHIAVLAGDGIGPEVMDQALKILKVINEKYGLSLEWTSSLVGGAAIDQVGEPLPENTRQNCEQSQAILFGAVGGPKWDDLPPGKDPVHGALLPLRKEFDLYANLRPAKVFPVLQHASPLRPDILEKQVDILIVRELTSGIYFGEPRGRESIADGYRAYDTMVYSSSEIQRVAKKAFELAKHRQKKVASVDKANVLASSVLWREEVNKMGKQYPEISLEHYYVDAAAMFLIREPQMFDVILTGNMFGDILSDEASTLSGSLGMLPSASLSDGNF
ncbi:MAG: 3-isopropylmalate dehydrogenase, partial [Candidatus Ranarchaeia archaeon]